MYVSNMTDKLVTPGKYFSAAEYHAQRLQAVRECLLWVNTKNEINKPVVLCVSTCVFLSHTSL